MLPLALVMLLAGCCKTTDSDAVCAAFRPISWSVEDTPETIAEVKAHNARRDAWCRGVMPAGKNTGNHPK
jgi:hypothetical protein